MDSKHRVVAVAPPALQYGSLVGGETTTFSIIRFAYLKTVTLID